MNLRREFQALALLILALSSLWCAPDRIPLAAS